MNKPSAQLPGRLALVIGSIVLGLLALEIGLRAWNGWLDKWPNFVLGARTVHTSTEQQRFRDDKRLGWLPHPGSADFDADGFRISDSPRGGTPVLAVGDSYTYGDEVSDGETWPAHLQYQLGQKVLNAGVSGYGFDQIVLRAEMLAATTHPSAIVVGFIADDIRRTEMKRLWGAEKPYFDIEAGKLALRNVPVPPRPDPRTTLSVWQWTLGYSLLFDFVLRRLDLLHDWFGDHVRVHEAGDGERIACLLTGRLAQLQAASGARVVVLAQYDPLVWQEPKFAAEQRRLTQGVLDCARRQGLAAVDSFEALSKWTGKGGPRGLYGLWHMNGQGNRLTAQLVAAVLAKPER